MVHTCPRCELRFTTEVELSSHLDTDHHVEWPVERYRYPIARPVGRRYLVVANRTLDHPSVVDRLRELVAGGGHIHLVVPASDAQGRIELLHPNAEDIALANVRAERVARQLTADGVDIEAEVADPDPFRAVSRALAHEPADEIVVSTLPRGGSRWLDVDLPGRLRHEHGLPVTVISPD